MFLNFSVWLLTTGVSQDSILGPLLFLTYIIDLFDNLQCNPRLFADNTSLFSTVKTPEKTANNLINDLQKINKCAFQWKMNFNSEPAKQAQEVILSRRMLRMLRKFILKYFSIILQLIKPILINIWTFISIQNHLLTFIWKQS